MKTTPFWWDTAQPQHGEQNIDFENCEVLIVGSGYTGLSAAITLAKEGVKDIVVIDEMRIGEGASSRNGGMYGTQPKFTFDFAQRKFGKQRANEIFDEYNKCTDFWLSRVSELDDEFDWQPNGSIKGAHSLKDYKKIESFYNSLPEDKKKDFSLYDKNEIKNVIDTDIYQGALVSHNYGGINPAKYVKALANKAIKLGVRIFTGFSYWQSSHVDNYYQVKLLQVSSKLPIHIKAKQIVLAVNGYAGVQMPWIRKRTIPVQSYMIATQELPHEQLEALLPNNRVVSDTKRVLYYYRRSPDGKRILFGGRASFTKSTEQQSALGLQRFMTHVFPSLKDVKITHSWLGNVCFSFDFVSHAGRMQDGIYYSSCCNGSGISMATYLGHRISESILGKPDTDKGIMNTQFPSVPFYNGKPWFLPAVGTWYRFLDKVALL